MPQFARRQIIRLPSTTQIDRRIARQTRKFNVWREQYLRLKDPRTGKGRWWAGPRPKKPPEVVHVLTCEGDPPFLLFHRKPGRRHPHTTEWTVPQVGVHPRHGPLFHLDSYMVMHEQFLRTVPSRRLLVVRGPTPAESPMFRAIQQEWLRIPRGYGSKFRKVGFHRWLCYVVTPAVEPNTPIGRSAA